MADYTPTTSEDLGKIEIIYFSNEFPKDDLNYLFRHLHNHSKSKCHQNLAQFIDETTFVIKEEIRRLPDGLKQLIPPFETLLSWVENTELREGLLCGAIDGVLLVLTQLAAFIGSVVPKFLLESMYL